MKKTLLLITLFMCCTLSRAQRLSLSTGAGIISNTGPRSEGLRQINGNHTHITGNLGLMYQEEQWQAGIGCQMFTMTGRARFIFEQDILPDRGSHTYEVAMGKPMYCTYLTASYNYKVSEHSYVFAGIRAGMLFSGQQTPSPYPFYYGYNDDAELMLPVNSSPMYGLQAGFLTHATKTLSAGALVFWQQAQASSDISYQTLYTLKDNNQLTAQPIIVEQSLKYHINMYSVQVFLRFALFNKAETESPTEKPENQ